MVTQNENITKMTTQNTNYQCWPLNLIDVIKTISPINCPALRKQEFIFKLSTSAAKTNWDIIQKYDNDITKAITAQHHSPLSFGSEFRPPNILQFIFRRHPLWPRMKQLLSEGSSWPLTPISNVERLKSLNKTLKYGNHKGASDKPDLLCQLVGQDVKNGFCLPLPLPAVHDIPRLVLAPMNIIPQFTIDDLGHIIGKDRLTHDQSFEFTEHTSVNSRCDLSLLQPCRFGHCLR